jgi:hypothetical protein
MLLRAIALVAAHLIQLPDPAYFSREPQLIHLFPITFFVPALVSVVCITPPHKVLSEDHPGQLIICA